MEAGDLNKLSQNIIGAAIEVHRQLGPGLLESAYEQCLAHELSLRGLACERQLPLSIQYKGKWIESAYRLDVIVEDMVVVELKAVEEVSEIHKVQLLTYLRFANKPLGLLMNFHSMRLVDGPHRIVNDAPES